MRIPFFVMAATLLGVAVAAAPLTTDLSEAVVVRLVTIDVLALDESQRTVPGLTKEAFRLFVDRKETPIDTFDTFCGESPEADPRSKRFGDWPTPPDLAEGTRRVVLVFDYLHLPTVFCPDLSPPGPCMLHTQALEAYRAAFKAKPEIHDEEIMVVALTGGLRVEQPFTHDRGAVLSALRRMEYDVTLWSGHFEHATESGFFEGLQALTTLLRVTPGPKSIVLLTAGSGPGDVYALDFARLATAASDAQARFYPVDCRGLFLGSGDPPGLDRLASMTGGRLTAGSNDFTIGYARARRDLGCHFTIGFYDRRPEEDRTHELRIESALPGIMVHHAASYSFPSSKVRHGMAVQAAYMVPTMFEGGGMRAEVFPLEPRDRKHWDVLVAIDFPVPVALQAGEPLRREFGAVLTSGPLVSKRFDRSVNFQGLAAGKGPTSRRLTFLEPAVLAAGRYTLTAVLSQPGADTAFTSRVELTVPDVPARRSFLVGPMIGRRSGPDVVIHGREDSRGAPADHIGGSQSFRPLIVTEIDKRQPLFALTEACVSKKDAKRGPWRVARRLETSIGGAAGALEDAVISSSSESAPSCERYLDEVPVSGLRFGGYTFSASLSATDPSSKSPIERRSATFFLTPEAAVDQPTP